MKPCRLTSTDLKRTRPNPFRTRPEHFSSGHQQSPRSRPSHAGDPSRGCQARRVHRLCPSWAECLAMKAAKWEGRENEINKSICGGRSREGNRRSRISNFRLPVASKLATWRSAVSAFARTLQSSLEETYRPQQ